MAGKISGGKQHFAIFPIFGAVIVAALLAVAGGFAFVANQESHDSFCSSCHTQPETVYYQREVAGQPVDLASFHTTQNTQCIACHSGQGVLGRISAELQGTHNAFLWYTGRAVQPAVSTEPIGDGNCLKCHQAVTQRGYIAQEQISLPGVNGGGREHEEGRTNHWHEFLSRWQAVDSNAGTCASCHAGHATSGSTQTGFMNAQNVQQVCNACHRVLRE